MQGAQGPERKVLHSNSSNMPPKRKKSQTHSTNKGIAVNADKASEIKETIESGKKLSDDELLEILHVRSSCETTEDSGKACKVGVT